MEKMIEWKAKKREGHQIKFMDLKLERGQVVGFRIGKSKMFHTLYVLGMHDDSWDRVLGLASHYFCGYNVLTISSFLLIPHPEAVIISDVVLQFLMKM